MDPKLPSSKKKKKKGGKFLKRRRWQKFPQKVTEKFPLDLPVRRFQTGKMATRSLWRARAKFAAATTAILGGAAAATVTTSDDPSRTLKLYTAVPVRLFRDTVTAASIAFGTFS